jgi:hypothetical protein
MIEWRKKKKNGKLKGAFVEKDKRENRGRGGG